jgi:sporulation integral membrane protein YlbJ
MTDRIIVNKSAAKKEIYKTEKIRSNLKSLTALIICISFSFFLSPKIAQGVRDGLYLCINTVVGSVFPFMIISDLYVAYGRAENMRLLGGVLSRFFGVPASALGAFICGNVAGFPIGAKMCADAYRDGTLGREEAERLIPLSNNPSCAFIIGGVGIGMCGDVRVGAILLFSVYAATAICAIVTKRKCDKTVLSSDNMRQSYSFVDSVKQAGVNSVSIISFICVFSVLCGIIKKRIKNALLIYPVFSLLEVTNAVDALANSTVFPPSLRLALVAFSLGFGGVCVGMQSSFFVRGAGLKMKNYYAVKFLEGLLAASIFSLVYIIDR